MTAKKSNVWQLPTQFECQKDCDHDGLPVFINDNPFDTIAFVLPRKGCNKNARLICAAPKLLKSLQDMLDTFAEYADDWESDSDGIAVLTEENAAIAEATGK